ncbi:unnamed protein product [Angiostrongylus costaricensis]|uniref:Uncharacterized protein n=1 Tax=Angiostrongylus costaricensis TaxID=334426 RepID=A0A0R3Q229_ANGCS|nr:unnamed protein product [Angiostrongylus costaricensis]
MPPYLKKVLDLVNSFEGARNSRILSPRFAPVVPEKRRNKGFLSPSLFPFYSDNTEEQILPIPKVCALLRYRNHFYANERFLYVSLFKPRLKPFDK